MAATLLRNPRSLLRRLPFAALSSSATAALEAPPSPALDPSPPPAAASKDLQRLKSAILSEPDPDRLVALFHSASAHKRFHSDHSLYSIAVKKLLRSRRPDLIDNLLSHSLSSLSSTNTDGFLALIINLYSDANMLNDAVGTFHRAVSTGHNVGDRSLSAVLSAFLKAGKIDAALEAFTLITKRRNLTPGLVPHNILLQVLCNKGDVPAARDMLVKMSESDSTQPDIISYTILLDAYLWKWDESGFDEIMQEITDKGLVPTVATYSHMITSLCRKKEMGKAEELLGEMVLKDVQPNRACFKTIIKAYSKVDDMENALRMFRRLKQAKKLDNRKELVPDSDIFNMLLKGLVKKREFESAFAICKECLGKKIVPSFELVKALAEGLRDNSKVDEAKDIVARMRAVVKGTAAGGWEKVEHQISFEEVEITEQDEKIA